MSHYLNEIKSALRKSGLHFRTSFYRAFAFAILTTTSLGSPALAQTESAYEYLATKIDNFGRIDDHYYRGGQPEDRDYAALAAFGIKTIIALTSHDTDPQEKVMAEKVGVNYRQIPMDSHTPPTDAQLEEFLQIVNDPANRPVFVHCAAGKHRTGVMTAAYRLTQHQWTADQAYKEMQQYKFGPALFHRKLKSFVYNYYKKLAHNKPSGPLLSRRKQQTD